MIRQWKPLTLITPKRRISCTLPPNEDKGRAHTHRTRLTNLLWRERYAKGSVDKSGALSLNFHKPQGEASELPLQDKTMRDSYCEIVLQFRQDLHLREEYINHFRALRLGKVLEDLDALAATCAYKHCLSLQTNAVRQSVVPSDVPNIVDIASHVPLNIVTASMDRMDLLNILRPDLDLKCFGCVTYAGKSSMEVTVRIASQGDPAQMKNYDIDTTGLPLQGAKNWTPLLLCKFTLVAKDPVTNKAVKQINRLVATNDNEQKLITMGEQRKLRRLNYIKEDLFTSDEAPSAAESKSIHSLWLQTRTWKSDVTPPSVQLMKNTLQQSLRVCHPQERNMHGSIFGGYLMKEAFELAYSTATLYIKSRPLTVAMDEIAFRKPVPIGSILQFKSEVVYAEGEPHRTFQVSVTAHVLRPENLYTAELSNTFHFTFARCEPTEKAPEVGLVDCLYPQTYGETMKWLLGKRRKDRGILEKKAQLEEFELFQPSSI